jgi:hypothetical protein
MAGLVPAIHVFSLFAETKTWMPGTRPGMTRQGGTMKMTRHEPSAIVLAIALLGLLSSRALAADDYPSRPVTIVVPFPPGASNDVLGRYEADVLARALHGSFVVENKPGAGGEIGISFAAKADPDGYTLLHAPRQSLPCCLT